MKVLSSFSLIVGVLAPLCGAQLDSLLVHTREGDVLGTLVTPTVRQFLGIPFGTAKRWEAPVPAPHRAQVFHATSFGDSCVQTLSPPNVEFLELVGGEGINVTESENCLSVNIWSPSIRRKQRTAVLVWIYGGGFVFGTSNISVYSGQNFVRDNDDITLVSFNYRLNIFGQPNAPQLAGKPTSQNFGQLDIDAAIQWVHDNIANFGGDPNRVTLFGQSAGSAAADAFTFAHPKDTRVQGIIEQSGSVSGQSTLIATNATLDPTSWNAVANAVGCGSDANAAQFTCMQKVPFRTLENAVISTNAAFGLVVDNITIFSDTTARVAAGNFLKVPLLGGTVAQEFDIFVLVQELLTTGTSIPVVTELLSDVETQFGFTCPAGVTALGRVNAGVRTWRYQYQAIFPDISTREELRAYHASEIPIVFGTYNNSAIPATPAEIALSRYVQQAWVAFARDPTQGLLNFGWPLYDPNTNSLAQLGNIANQTGVVFTKGALLDASCAQASTLVAIETQLLGLFGPSATN